MNLIKLSLAVLVSIHCVAISVNAQTTDAPIEDPQPLIEVGASGTDDGKIDSRIENIFAKIKGIETVTVEVEAGVVTLAGEVANDALANDARDIAIRTAGVVTVEDSISRTLDVQANVTPIIEGFRESITIFTRALPLILLSLIIFLLFGFLGGQLARLTGVWRRISPNPFLAELLSQAVRIVMLIVGAIIALNLLGASKFITTILGGAGVLGIAIGFAVRDSMENYISSIMLSLRQPFRANDHVVINEHEGIVMRLTSRATILMTLDGNHLRIPNSVVFKGIILNYTTNPERRFDFELGVDAEDDPIIAMQVGLQAVVNNEFVLTEPKPSAAITTVGDSNIVIKFTGWVDQSETDFSKARSLAISSAMSVLDDEGFTLPEPIYRLRFDDPITKALQDGVLSTEALGSDSETPPQKKSNSMVQEESLDVAPDTHLADKVAQERSQESEHDLLDENQPAE